MSLPSALAQELAPDPFLTDIDDDDLSVISYDNVLHIARRWVWPGVIPVGGPMVLAAAGETGKGLLMAAAAARVALGLPFPGEHPDIRRGPAGVIWITAVGEDDPNEDLAPRLRAAIAAAVAEFGLDPALAGPDGAITNIYDLSKWRHGLPLTLPADAGLLVAEVAKLNQRNEHRGRPPVAMVVADSLSALLSEGFTINSRQGARRVMGILSAAAREADIAMVLVHHMTRDGKVAGSPAVLDALRIAFRIERLRDNEDVRVIIRHKANISRAEPVRYVIEGSGVTTHAAFAGAVDARTARVEAAQERAALRPPVRVALGAGAGPGAPAGPREPGPFALMRVTLRNGETEVQELLGRAYATRADATAAADRDAGAVLSWADLGRGLIRSVYDRADGARVSYGVALAAMVPDPV
jgi:AAA domain